METILPAYDDPLFSLLLIAAIALIVAVVSYGWGVYKQQREEEKLVEFLEGFGSQECELDTHLLTYEAALYAPLKLLAQAYDRSGEYHKAIGLYRYILSCETHKNNRNEILLRLGTTYLHAGFLERSEKLLLELLRTDHKNRIALETLGVVYEQMRRFDKLQETIEPLQELGVDTSPIKRYLHFMSLIHPSGDTDISQRAKKLYEFSQNDATFYHAALEALFRIDPSLGWQSVASKGAKEVLDIMWLLPASQLDLDIISCDPILKALFYARGDLAHPPEYCGNFTIDMAVAARKHGLCLVELDFSYLCVACKHTFPVSFIRCPKCHTIGTMKVEESIAQATSKKGHPLL